MEAAAEARVSLWQTVKGDLSGTGGLRLVGVIAMLAWMAFQWGWGNDVLLPPIVASAFDAVDDGETWLSAIGATGAATGAGALFWGFTQALDGIVVLSGLRLVPGLTRRISNFIGEKGWLKPYDEFSLGTRFLIAYATGASVLCLIDVFATGQQGLRQRRRMLAEAVGLAVAGVAAAVAVVASIGAIGSRVPATADEAEVVIRYAKNPLTWLVIYGSIVGISAAVGRVRS